MQIPIIQSGQPMPATGPAYVIGKDGFYLRKKSRLYESLVQVEMIPDFNPVTEYVNWNAPKLPYDLIEESLEFFRAVYDKHEAEAIALLALNDGIWNNVVPEQNVTSAHLDYKLPKLDGLAGTIHSHGHMDAFFSETDHQDVAGFDGVHIVLGRIDRNIPRIKTGVYVNGRLFEFEPEALIDGIPEEQISSREHPWLERVRRGKSSLTTRRNRIDDDYLWPQEHFLF